MKERLMPKQISATEAANRFGTLMDEAARGASLFVVTRMGQPKVVLIGVEAFQEMLELIETAEELADSEYLSGIVEAREDIELGRTMSLDELEEALNLTPTTE